MRIQVNFGTLCYWTEMLFQRQGVHFSVLFFCFNAICASCDSSYLYMYFDFQNVFLLSVCVCALRICGCLRAFCRSTCCSDFSTWASLIRSSSLCTRYIDAQYYLIFFPLSFMTVYENVRVCVYNLFSPLWTEIVCLVPTSFLCIYEMCLPRLLVFFRTHKFIVKHIFDWSMRA